MKELLIVVSLLIFGFAESHALTVTEREPEGATITPSDGQWNCWTWDNPNKTVQEKNKVIVLEFYQKLFGDKDLDAIEQYVGDRYTQHNPLVKDGKEGIREAVQKWLKDIPKRKLDIKRVGADGDLVWVHLKMYILGRDHAIVDIFRVKDGKVVEHWDVIQGVPEKSENDNTMF